MGEIFDLIIIGAGPAAYTASIYASRYKLNHMIIGEVPGGTASLAHKVCNFPSQEDISGIDLMMKMRNQALSYGPKEFMDRAVDVKKMEDGTFIVKGQNYGEFHSKFVLIAIGTKRRKLGIATEDTFIGKGVSYCATCDAMFYKNKVVAVIGGANAATMSAVYLADVAEKVYVIYRKDKLRGDVIWVEQVEKNPKIEVLYNSNVMEFVGNEKLSGVKLDSRSEVLPVDGAFIEIGAEPIIDFNPGVNLNPEGYIVVDAAQKTSIDGLYAAGDITTNSNQFEQIITACSEGAVAVNAIFYAFKKG